ncbi:glycosyltransferase family 2 protein [Cellulosimicrobium terreum]|nr:glycosyltransferase family 2 protein [Cellulosimicrobium terreum]
MNASNRESVFALDPEIATAAARSLQSAGGAEKALARALRSALAFQSSSVREVVARLVDPRSGVQDLLDRARRTPEDLASLTDEEVKALCGLARVIGLQQFAYSDLADSITLYTAARDLLPVGGWSFRDATAFAQLCWFSGARAQLGADAELLARVPLSDRRFLELDLLGAARGVGSQAWLDALSAVLDSTGSSRVLLGEGATPFDRLGSALEGGTASGSLVTVIVPAYRPGPEILTAVRSVAEQTWGDVEILVVDDASGPEFSDVFGEVSDMDPRVRVLTQTTNMGTYAARNRAMSEARGEFITFQDADDWSHPARIQLQVEPLLEDQGLLRTLSTSIRCSSALEFQYLGFATTRSNASSHLFRQSVLDSVGGFDWVRKSADSEFDRRLEAWKPGRRLQLDALLAFVRLEPDSLSRGDFRPGWMHPARAEYRASMLHWHEKISAGAPPLVSADRTQRSLSAPRAFLRGLGAPETHLDVVYACDWTQDAAVQRAAVDEIRALVAGGAGVGLASLSTVSGSAPVRGPLARAVRRLLASGEVTFVSLEDSFHVPTLVVRQPEVLEWPTNRPVSLTVDRVVIVADDENRDPEAGPAWCVSDCDHNARSLFGVAPSWWVRSESARDAIAPVVGLPRVIATDFPRVVDAARGRVPRVRKRGERTIVGWVFEDASSLPDRALLTEAFPEDGSVDVRLLGPRALVRQMLGTVPAEWLVYEPGEISARELFFQVDVVVGFPARTDWEPSRRAVLEALVSGRAVVLDPAFRDEFGDAAAYCHLEDLNAELISVIAGQLAGRTTQTKLPVATEIGPVLDLVLS